MKKKNWKRIFSMTLSLLMLVGLMAGCGSSESTNGSSSESTKESSKSTNVASSESTKEDDSGSLLNPGGTYPVVKEGELELSMFTMSMPNVEDFATNDFTKYMEELTGIKMEFLTGGRDDWQDRLNMLLQTDDYPDIIFNVAPNIAKYGVGEGIFIPLDEYLTEENVPNYLKVMEEFNLDVTRETDGKIYSLAEINDCFHCKYARKMWVNTYYLEQMGVEVPTTTEEFMDVCKKFLELKPDGIAVAGAETGWFTRMQDWLMGAYTFIPVATSTFRSGDYIARKGDEMLCVATTDEYK